MPWIFCCEALSDFMGLLLGSVDGDRARQWRLIYWLIGMIEEIKSPCGCRGFFLMRVMLLIAVVLLPNCLIDPKGTSL